MTFNSGNFFARNATEVSVAACDQFFEWISHFNGDFSQSAETRFNTLFTYFEAWATEKAETLDRTFADGSGTQTWEAFAPLLPCIYIGIIDRVMLNPSLLDYEFEDPLLQTSITICRPMRRVSWLSGDGDNHEQNMDYMLDWVRSPSIDSTSEGYAPHYRPTKDPAFGQ